MFSADDQLIFLFSFFLPFVLFLSLSLILSAPKDGMSLQLRLFWNEE